MDSSNSGKRIVNGTFQPGENDDDTSVVLEETPAVVDEASLSQQFYDCNSFDNDLLTGTTASASWGSKKSARRPSDVGSIPLKPYVGAVSFDGNPESNRRKLTFLCTSP